MANWKTTLAGAVALIAQFVGSYFPQFKTIADAVSALSIAVLGYFAADASTKKS